MTALFFRRGRIATVVAWAVFVLIAIPVFLYGIYDAFAGTRR